MTHTLCYAEDMEEEKLQAAKSILLDNDGNKFAAIKAFMAQQGTDIDTAASYINQAYISLDSPSTSVPSSTAMVPYCPPPQKEVVVREYVVDSHPQPEPESTAGLIIFAILASLAKTAWELGWLFLKIVLYCVFILPFKVATFLLLFFYTDKAINRRRRDYWF